MVSQEGSEVASYMLAAKLRKVTSKNVIKAFDMFPETGSIEPFEACKLTVRFQPQDAPPGTGFRSKELPAELAEQDYEYIVSFDMEGQGQLRCFEMRSSPCFASPSTSLSPCAELMHLPNCLPAALWSSRCQVKA